MSPLPRPLRYGSEILRLAFLRRGISRAEAAGELGLDKATVTRVVKELVDRGLLRELMGEDLSVEGRGGSEVELAGRQGRRRIPLAVNDACGCVLGLEVQEESVKVGLVLPSGRVVHTRHFPRPARKGAGASAAVNAAKGLERDMVDAAEAGRAEARRLGIPVLGLGAALTGLVDASAGALLFSRGLGVLSGPLPLRGNLERRLGHPVMLDNDAKCCCYDALAFSDPPAQRDFLYVFCELPEDDLYPDRYLRVGLGTAVVLDGRVQYGSRFAAGEFRSAVADPAVPGQFGRRNPSYYLRIKTDPLRRARFVRDLALNVGFIANFLDLKEIRIGGGIEAYKDELSQALEAALASLWLYRRELPRNIALRFADTEAKPAVRGAAAMVIRRIFAGSYHPSAGPTGLEYLDAIAGR